MLADLVLADHANEVHTPAATLHFKSRVLRNIKMFITCLSGNVLNPLVLARRFLRSDVFSTRSLERMAPWPMTPAFMSLQQFNM